MEGLLRWILDMWAQKMINKCTSLDNTHNTYTKNSYIFQHPGTILRELLWQKCTSYLIIVNCYSNSLDAKTCRKFFICVMCFVLWCAFVGKYTDYRSMRVWVTQNTENDACSLFQDFFTLGGCKDSVIEWTSSEKTSKFQVFMLMIVGPQIL